MPSESSFKEQLAKFRRELLTSSDAKGLLRTLREMQTYVDEFPDDSNRKICAAHLGKELLDWISQKEDTILETDTGKCCTALLERLLIVCHTAQDAIRSYCVARLYNAVITLNNKVNCQLLRMRVCDLMSQFPIADEQVDLFDRIKRLLLKTVQDAANGLGVIAVEGGIDSVIEMQRKLMVHVSGKPSDPDGTRSAALTLFREVFDTTMAVLFRIFTISRRKAHQLFCIIMDTMSTVVQPNETELISLLNDSIGFLEYILSFSGNDGEYLEFLKFFTIFKNITREPYASCYHLLWQQVQLQQQTSPEVVDIKMLTDRLRSIKRDFLTNALVVKVAIFLTCQGAVYFNRLPQDAAPDVAAAAIDLFQSLMRFVPHCPAGTVQELCRKCTSSRRHMADRLLTVMVQLSIFQAKHATEPRTTNGQEKPPYSIDRVCELIKGKFSMLEKLECERKRAAMDTTVRQTVTWVKYALTFLRDDPTAGEDAAQVLEVLRILISTQNRHRFEFLSDLHLVRLLENCHIKRSVCTSVQASDSCWSGMSIRMLKLLLALRETSDAVSEEDHTATISSTIRSIIYYKVNAAEDDPIRSLSTIQLYDHPSFDRHGFEFDCLPSPGERFVILAEEMTLAVKYKTTISTAPWEYFLELSKLGDLRANCLTFGMTLYGLSDSDVAKIPVEIMDELCANLVEYEPRNVQERIKRSASRAMASYHSFSLLSRASLNRMRELPFKIEQFRNDQIDELLIESQVDREIQLIDHMESVREQYGEMVAALAEDRFRSLWVLPSIVQIGSILDNTARYFQLNYYPHRAVELQLLNLLLVSQRREERPLDQCAPLGFLLEEHRQTEELVKRFALKETPNGGKLGSLEELSKRATSLLESFSMPARRFVDDVPDNRKFQFLNLYLGLAVYHASKGELDQSLELIQRTLAHLPQHGSSPVCEGREEDGKTPPSMETITQLLKGRTAQIIFRLVVEYELSWPGPDCAVPPVVTFLKLMLASFNELQKLPNEHTFIVSLATVEMTVAVLQYLIIRYDTGALIEPYVDQLLKFVIRRGAGLRVMQILLLYGYMSADMQKLDRCEVTLRYLDRLLMLRPIVSCQKKENGKKMEDPILMHENMSAHHRQRMPLAVHAAAENDVDDERKAIPKHLESSITPAFGRTHSASNYESPEPSIEQYLMFRHLTNCGCRYCRYPQYKWVAFQTAGLAARLSALQRTQSTKRTKHFYHSIIDHWLTVIGPAFDQSTQWCGAAYRADLVTVVIRLFVHWGQFLGKLHCFAPALEAYECAFRLSERSDLRVTIDPALLEDVRFNRTTMRIAQRRAGCGHPLRHKRSRLMIEQSYQEAIAKGRISTVTNVVREMAALSTELNKLVLKTPKQPSSSSRSGGSRAPPKTADRVNELIRQAASRRHQLKKNAGDQLSIPSVPVPAGKSYSASARKPKTVNIFLDSPPPPSGSVPAALTTVKITKVNSSVNAKVMERISMVDLCDEVNGASSSSDLSTIPTPSGGLVDVGSHRKRRFGKRPLVRGEPTTPSNNSSVAYRDALAKTVPCAPCRAVTKGETGKLRRLVLDDFPSLSESSDTDVSTAKTPQEKSTTQTSVEIPCAGLNGSFRDVLVLSGPRQDSSSCVIVLDDSPDSRQSNEAIEANFVENGAAVSTGKNSALSLKSYSDRKRLHQGSCPGLPSSTPSPVSVKRRTPLMASKIKLRFDDPSPEHDEKDQPAHDERAREVNNNKKTILEADLLPADGFVNVGNNTRTRMKKTSPVTIDPMTKETIDIPLTSTTSPSGDTIATRTRQRRKRI